MTELWAARDFAKDDRRGELWTFTKKPEWLENERMWIGTDPAQCNRIQLPNLLEGQAMRLTPDPSTLVDATTGPGGVASTGASS